MSDNENIPFATNIGEGDEFHTTERVLFKKRAFVLLKY